MKVRVKVRAHEGCGCPGPSLPAAAPRSWHACASLRYTGTRNLQAPQIPGDGRELIATDPCAVKIRAEDGRSVVHRCFLCKFLSMVSGSASPTSRRWQHALRSAALQLACLRTNKPCQPGVWNTCRRVEAVNTSPPSSPKWLSLPELPSARSISWLALFHHAGGWRQ